MLSDKLKTLREQNNITQAELAKHLNITQTGYYGYEKGNRNPPYETLVRLADFYNVTTDYLLEHKISITKPIGEIDYFSELLENLKILSVQQQRELAKYVQYRASGEFNFYISIIDDIKDLTQRQQNLVSDYVRLLKLDNVTNSKSSKKKTKPPTSYAPAIAASGMGIIKMDAEMIADAGKAFDNKKAKE